MKRVLFRPQAARDLERLPNRNRDQGEEAIERFAQTGSNEIRMLAGEGRHLRLRVGDWRVRFVYEKPSPTTSALFSVGRANDIMRLVESTS